VPSPKTILTVDDSRTIRDMLRVTLAAAGYEVVQAEDGVEALERLADTQPAAIVTDINMPRMDGFELIESVRKGGAHKATPILVLTTESEPDRKARAKEAGATGWIVKPFNPEKLLEALRRVGA
jgi:two-component system chemotaxis response regulator CheY